MANRKSNNQKKKQPEKRSYSLPTLIVLIALSALLFWLSVAKPEANTMVGSLQGVLHGLTGHMTAVLPVLMLYVGAYQLIARRKGTFSVFHVIGVVLLALCLLTGAEMMVCPQILDRMNFYSYPNFAYNAYLAQTGGGILGSLAWFLYTPLGMVGGMIVIIMIALVDLVLLGRVELAGIIGWFTARKSNYEERAEKRRQKRELDQMFEPYDDFDEPPVRQRKPASRPASRTRSEANRLYDLEEDAAVQKLRSERRARTQRPVEPDAELNRPRRETARSMETARPVRPARENPLFDDAADMDDIPPLRSRRNAPQRETATARPAAAKVAEPAVRTARPKPEIIEEEIETIDEQPKRFYEETAEAKEYRPERRTGAGAQMKEPKAAPAADPFGVQRTKLKDDSPIDGNDFAGGHTKTVHGKSALAGEAVKVSIGSGPRAGMGMPPLELEDDEDEGFVPMQARDLTIEPEVYEQPDDDVPFDLDDAPPAKQLGRFTRRVKPEDEEPEIEYNYPPLDLLAEGDRAVQEDTEEMDLEKAQELEDTLRSFGVEATMSGIAHGPAVTRFEFKLPRGVKVNKIAGLADDIAYNLAAESVRIEAPIPGKTAVGVEIPNEKVEMVPLRDVLESPDARNHASRIAVGLGKDNAGRYIMADIAKMPHVLIAGQTGSGKSVCINSIIMSILYRATPDEVKLILIDPKVVELSVYNEIPHLIAPVVTDPKKAAAALDWAVVEMSSRYKKFSDAGVRNIKGYNSHLPEGQKPMPQIVIIIDELADLMMAAPGEVEDSICRLAQLARAAGMHLVIATQRPSVNVITGLIKANIPSRVAFKVASNIDSRTIFDRAGAEKLLGNGDMLYVPSGISKPMRVQGAWVSDDEVESVVNYIKSRHENGYDEDVMEHMNRSTTPEAERDDAIDDEHDDRLEEAVEIVIDAGQASISMLQRKMRVGYARAGRLIDEMCRRGIVSEADGSKPRTVLITKEQFYNAFVDD